MNETWLNTADVTDFMNSVQVVKEDSKHVTQAPKSRHTWLMTSPDHEHAYTATFETQVLAFIDQHREMLAASLEGLTEDEVRRRLVPSRTTLLGLVKHAAFVERVWFQQARTGISRAILGIPESPDESFVLEETDSISSVVEDFKNACVESREAMVGVTAETVWTGNRRGPLPVQWILLHVLRELAQHCGHADILREQILAAR